MPDRFDAYIITCTANGKVYVGITTVGVELRWQRHVNSAKAGSKIPLHRAIRKYGSSAFVVTHAASARNYADLQRAEMSLIAQSGCMVPSGYNCTTGGKGSYGFKFTPEHIRNLSEAHKGKRQSEEAKRKIQKASTGRRHTEATRQLISEIARAKMPDSETRRRAARGIIEYAQSDRGRAEASSRMQLQLQDPAFACHRDQTGRKRTTESRKRMSDARKRMFASNPRARQKKLTIEQVAEIKWLLLNGEMTQAAIANQFGVRQTQISNIRHGLCWADVAPTGAT